MRVLDSIFTANVDQLLAELRDDVDEGIEFDAETVCSTIRWISHIQLSEKSAEEVARLYMEADGHYGIDEIVKLMAKAAIVGFAVAIQAMETKGEPHD